MSRIVVRNSDAAVLEMAQRSNAWKAARVGRLTGAGAGALLAQRLRGKGELEIRARLRSRLVAERLTGIPLDDNVRGKAIDHGIETEPAAFRAYEARTGMIARRVGFLQLRSQMAGASPDGLVQAGAGVLEMKCPNTTTHLDYLESGQVPEEYVGQLLHNVYIAGAEWADFVSFDPRLPAHLQLFRVRFEPTASELHSYRMLVAMFLAEVDVDYERVLARVA